MLTFVKTHLVKCCSNRSIVSVKVPCRTGLGNVRPTGHMLPAKHLNVARLHLFRLMRH